MRRFTKTPGSGIRRESDTVCLPYFRAWQRAIGMPLWRVMAATDLADATIYKAETGRPIRVSVARLLAVALEVPFDSLVHVDPDHEDAREIVRIRAAEVKEELAAHNARIEARRLAYMQSIDRAAA